MRAAIVPESHRLDEYAEFAHRAVAAAKAMYPGARTYAADGSLREVPVLCELPDGEVAVVRYQAVSENL